MRIQSCGKYNIKSSTDTVINCIKGTINVNMQLLLKNDENVKIFNFRKSTVKFLVADESVTLDRLLLGIPFLKEHCVKMHLNKNNCKMLGNFKTEQGYNKVRLYTTIGDRNIIQGVNLTEIKQGYSLVDFQINKVICTDFQAGHSQPKQLGLKFPDYVQIKSFHFVRYKHNGWPFVEHSKNIRLPVNSEDNLMKNKVILHFKYNENKTQV